MASITIRMLDDGLKRELKNRASRHGCSMEEEARRILRDTLNRERPQSIVDIARELFGPEHGFDLDIPSRDAMREPPDFGAP